MQNIVYENNITAAENVKQILHHETMANQVAILNEKLKKSEPSHTDVDEEDLILAAKLGKALLEKNEDLTSEHHKLMSRVEVRMLIFL